MRHFGRRSTRTIGVYERVYIGTHRAGNPTVITTVEPHGLTTGRQVNIGGVTGNVPSLNALQRATVISPTQFSIPVVDDDGRASAASPSARVFGGYNITPRERGMLDEPVTPIFTEVTAVSFDQMTERRFVNEVLVTGTMKSMLTTIVAHYFAAGGVVVDAQQVDGPVLPAVPCTYALARDVLDTIAGLAGGYVWELDPYLNLRMYLPVERARAVRSRRGRSPRDRRCHERTDTHRLRQSRDRAIHRGRGAGVCVSQYRPAISATAKRWSSARKRTRIRPR